jgi:hypothetical protein
MAVEQPDHFGFIPIIRQGVAAPVRVRETMEHFIA